MAQVSADKGKTQYAPVAPLAVLRLSIAPISNKNKTREYEKEVCFHKYEYFISFTSVTGLVRMLRARRRNGGLAKSD